MIRRYWLLLTLTIFLALALAACGDKGDNTSPAEETAAPAAQATVRSSAAEKKPTAAPHHGNRGCAHRRTHGSARGDTRG